MSKYDDANTILQQNWDFIMNEGGCNMEELNVFDYDELKEVMAEDGRDKLDEYANYAVLTTSNYAGMVVVINSTGESVFVQEVWGEGKFKEIQESEIKFDEDEEPYFKYEDGVYSLNDFMRVNY